MRNSNKKTTEIKKILFFSFNFLPDQSAGSIRSSLLIKKIIEINNDVEITLLCSYPKRYGNKKLNVEEDTLIFSKNIHRNIKIKRFWIPFLGQGPFVNLISYSFYFFQALLFSLFLKPDLIVVTSAKLLTSFLATLSSKINKAKLFIDLRDTFSDNYIYFYRWKKRALLAGIFLLLENYIFSSAYSINIVSLGFKEAFYGWEKILEKNHITLTNFTNAISKDFKKLIKEATNNIKRKNKFYKVVYAGNIGAGQDLLSLINSLSSNKTLLKKMIEEKIVFYIYGSGAQLKIIKKIIDSDNSNLLNKFIFYKGLLPRDQISKVYSNADCLMINLGRYSSLSLVIPSKIFEYAATPYPILFSAKGYTYDFIKNVNGTISYELENPLSFYNALKKSKKLKINSSKRELFLDQFDSDKEYLKYAKHILGIN